VRGSSVAAGEGSGCALDGSQRGNSGIVGDGSAEGGLSNELRVLDPWPPPSVIRRGGASVAELPPPASPAAEEVEGSVRGVVGRRRGSMKSELCPSDEVAFQLSPTTSVNRRLCDTELGWPEAKDRLRPRTSLILSSTLGRPCPTNVSAKPPATAAPSVANSCTESPSIGERQTPRARLSPTDARFKENLCVCGLYRLHAKNNVIIAMRSATAPPMATPMIPPTLCAKSCGEGVPVPRTPVETVVYVAPPEVYVIVVVNTVFEGE
jgi:hypothetical protein